MSEEEWIWGNTRGGGGAPLKTMKGEQIANLRQVVRGEVEIDGASPSRKREDNRSYDRHDRSYERDDRDRSYDRDDSDRRIAASPIKGLENHYKDTPPAKGFRNIQVEDSERQERIRKAKEYQELLREQVEEKKREKEAAKRKDDVTKKKEYDAYIRDTYRGKPSPRVSPRGGGGARDGGSFDSPRVDRRRNRDRDPATPTGPPKGGRGGGRDRDDDYDDRDRRRGEGGGRDRDRDRRGGGGRDYDNDDVDDRAPRRGGGGAVRVSAERDIDRGSRDRGGKGRHAGGGDDDMVSREEYMEVQALCARLMDRQKELIDEVTLQAEVIEDLRAQLREGPRRGAPAAAAPSQQRAARAGSERGGAPGKGVGARAAAKGIEAAAAKAKKKPAGLAFGRRQGAADKDDASDGLRSQSVHGKVSGKDRAKAGGGLKLPAVDRRPASMHSGAPQVKKKVRGDDIAAVAARASPRGGGNVPARGRGKAPRNRPTDDSEDGGGGGGNGFMKLAAMGAKKKAGPVVVTYEDEGEGGSYDVRGSPARIHKGGGGGLRDSNTELRGASEHLYVGGADVDGINDDQLDRLLNRARGARN